MEDEGEESRMKMPTKEQILGAYKIGCEESKAIIQTLFPEAFEGEEEEEDIEHSLAFKDEVSRLVDPLDSLVRTNLDNHNRMVRETGYIVGQLLSGGVPFMVYDDLKNLTIDEINEKYYENK